MSPQQPTLLKRKAFPCKKCSGEDHWKNKIGGIQCFACSPPRHTTDVVVRLRIEDGQWVDDSTPRFDLVDAPNAEISACQTAAITPRQTDQKPKASQQNANLGAGFIVAYSSRGMNGEFSEQEIDLFTSDAIWDQPDQWIVLKPKVRVVNRLGGRNK